MSKKKELSQKKYLPRVSKNEFIIFNSLTIVNYFQFLTNLHLYIGNKKSKSNKKSKVESSEDNEEEEEEEEDEVSSSEGEDKQDDFYSNDDEKLKAGK